MQSVIQLLLHCPPPITSLQGPCCLLCSMLRVSTAALWNPSAILQALEFSRTVSLTVEKVKYLSLSRRNQLCAVLLLPPEQQSVGSVPAAPSPSSLHCP